MTIIITPAQAAVLSASGEENNPIVAHYNLGKGAVVTTGVGAEVQSAGFAVTGTTYDSWVATPDTGSAAIHIDLGNAQFVSFAAIAGHNLSDIGASVRAQYSSDAISWTDCGAGPDTPADDQAIAFYFVGITARYWRFLVFDAGTSDVQLSVAFVGNPITIGRRIYQGYAPPITPNVVDLQSNVSEGGNLLGSSVVRCGSTVQASLSNITPTFLRSPTWTSFQSHFNAVLGFFWAWRPTKYGDIHYAWREGGVIAPANSGPKDYMAFSMGMRLLDK